jgi:hypothetical protein
MAGGVDEPDDVSEPDSNHLSLQSSKSLGRAACIGVTRPGIRALAAFGAVFVTASPGWAQQA